MPRWKLTLAYDGTSFNGWQIQPHVPTIQGLLAQSIHHLTGEQVLPQGSGRTDAGVHALAQVASFDLDADIPPANLLRALNRSLPASIRVLTAEHASADFHARHTALRKTYEYRIHPRRAVINISCPTITQPQTELPLEGAAQPDHEPDRICPPTLAPYVWDCPWSLNLGSTSQAAKAILGTHCFTSFAAADPDQTQRTQVTEPGNTRTIYTSAFHAQLDRDPPLVLYQVTGSGFLHHMVRNLVGTFVDIARGRLAADSIPAILAARDRAAAGPTAPAQGLFLHSVEYPA